MLLARVATSILSRSVLYWTRPFHKLLYSIPHTKFLPATTCPYHNQTPPHTFIKALYVPSCLFKNYPYSVNQQLIESTYVILPGLFKKKKKLLMALSSLPAESGIFKALYQQFIKKYNDATGKKKQTMEKKQKCSELGK